MEKYFAPLKGVSSVTKVQVKGRILLISCPKFKGTATSCMIHLLRSGPVTKNPYLPTFFAQVSYALIHGKSKNNLPKTAFLYPPLHCIGTSTSSKRGLLLQEFDIQTCHETLKGREYYGKLGFPRVKNILGLSSLLAAKVVGWRFLNIPS